MILGENIKFRGGLLGIKAFKMLILLKMDKVTLMIPTAQVIKRKNALSMFLLLGININTAGVFYWYW